MRRALYILLAIIALGCCAAGCRSSRALSPEQAAADSLANKMAQRLFDRQQFVLTADRITLGNSPVLSVADNLNFVLVNGSNGVIQLSPRMSGGPNGVGGITASGSVTNYEVSVTAKGETVVKFHLTAPAGSADVRITLARTGSGATAYVDATFHRGRATLMGKVNPLPASVISGKDKTRLR